jgi:amidohydrolase
MQIIQDRRALHQIPEPDLRLPKTTAYVKNALSNLRCSVFSPAESAICAWFDFGADRAIAFRADMDALAIAEKTGLPFASTHPGFMHACGHDGHTAMLLELARRLDAKQELGVNVLLVFQPAEESVGGAHAICQSGVFQQYGVEAIFGLHLWPGVPKGRIAGRKNELMARSSELQVEITGRACHIAKAEDGIDALKAAVQFYNRVTNMADALPKNIYRILNFGRFDSGTAQNIISGHTHMEGTLRAFQDEIFDRLASGIRDAAAQVAAETGCTIDISLSDGYPAVMNPPDLFDSTVKKSGVDILELPAPYMIAEDFSWYQHTLPGLFLFLGVGNTPALHANNFQFDESVLTIGADFFQRVAETY